MGKRVKRLIASSPYLTAIVLWAMMRLRLAPGLGAVLRAKINSS